MVERDPAHDGPCFGMASPVRGTVRRRLTWTPSCDGPIWPYRLWISRRPSACDAWGRPARVHGVGGKARAKIASRAKIKGGGRLVLVVLGQLPCPVLLGRLVGGVVWVLRVGAVIIRCSTHCGRRAPWGLLKTAVDPAPRRNHAHGRAGDRPYGSWPGRGRAFGSQRPASRRGANSARRCASGRQGL